MIIEEYQKKRDTNNLEEFFAGIENRLAFSSLDEKSRFITCLLNDLQEKNWDETTQAKALSTIRILGRDTAGSDPIFTKETMQFLINLAGLHTDEPKETASSCEALKCIANSIYLKSDLKECLDSEIISLHKLVVGDNPSQDTQFLVCRILFFMTVNRADLVTQLINDSIEKTLEKILTRNVSILEKQDKPLEQQTLINPVTVTSEALKLLFNLMLVDLRNQTDPQTTAERFKQCLVPIFHILYEIPPAESQPMVPPHSQAIHALMQYPFSVIQEVWRSQTEWTSTLYDTLEEGVQRTANLFFNLLNKSVHALIPNGNPDDDALDHQYQQIDSILSPLLLVIRTLAEGNPALRECLAEKMLPSEEDRLRPVHQGDKLPAYMIRLMTSTMLPQTRNAICETYFVLCDEDANKFTQQVGYGNAIGFLVNKGIPMEPPKDSSSGDDNINPITGQYLSAEDTGPSLADMTDEEKEREAEKLFVLFERLKKTGIVDVENPIAKAMREGKLEEIQDEGSDSE
ncbi:hypothetical protein CU097_004743 [Rhizopus azygosporus]|uniref:Guanine nucleotide exchange factor synembryn n=1 Tax=Rhizopus azygosporus TaxID=86630 RepID=A0A367JY34_RHIAZ|nr:hypothetical protein CU097_004743 [Rhizopus azygosporus]